MRKAAGSWAAKLLALIGGYVAALSAMRALFRSFDYYIGKVFGRFVKMGAAASIMLFAVFAAALVASVMLSQKRGAPIRRPPMWRGIDLPLLAALAFAAVVLFIFYAAANSKSMAPEIRLALLSIAAYLTAMALLAEAAARVRDRSLASRWPAFFRQHPIWHPAGALMAALLAGNLAYLCVLYPYGASRGHISLASLLSSTFTLSALTYFCSFLLSLSEKYEKANAGKIKSERFKAELITNVSHDIRTPLTSIINYVDLLKALPVEHGSFAEYVGILEKKSARLKTLIGDLMEASKASSGNMKVELRDVDLAEIVGQIAGEFDDQFAERGLTLAPRHPGMPIIVKADGGHLWRVLENLFGNAAKYSMPGTRVFAEIAAHVGGGGAAFIMKNTSSSPIDMPADELEQQFMRGDRARKTEGSGLGLHIAKSLVELMGGSFAIRASGDLFEAEIVFANHEP